MSDKRELDDGELNATVVRLDIDLHQVAVWGHLLQDEVRAGNITFPITGQEELLALYTRASNTRFVGDATLRPPGVESVPSSIFPIINHGDFLNKALAVIRFDHTLKGTHGTEKASPANLAETHRDMR